MAINAGECSMLLNHTKDPSITKHLKKKWFRKQYKYNSILVKEIVFQYGGINAC